MDPRADESLLETLRERCGIRSLKDGCAPQGQCGCCLALIDGHAKVTCAMSARSAQGRHILTLEGLSDADRDLFSRAFAAAAGVQCGFCIPGIALRAKHLLDTNPQPTRADIARAIDQHLCRCTGYKKIVDAIELMARGRRGETIPAALQDGGVGDRLARYDGVRAALGDRPFVDDLTRPDLLHGALVLSDSARSIIRRIDTSRAKAHPGVVAVVTAVDVPGERWYGLIEQDWPGLVAEGEEARWVGDVLAAVAATDRHTAREAAELVSVEYEALPPVLDPDAALAEGAPRVNPRHPNLLSRSIVIRGDADAALTRSAHVVHGTWQTQRVEHLFLEPESALAEMTPAGGIRLYSQGQGIFDDRRQVAAFLGVAEARVFVELVPSGGAFGGKEDMSVQAQTALLCLVTGRPVKLTLSREESIRIHPKRHPIRMEYSVGCDDEGYLTAVKARMIGDSGAYASVGAKVMERAAGHACGPYRVPNVDVESLAVYTNNPPCGAMRGFGANQVHFAMEGCVDLLAKKVGLDGWEMRWRNALDAGDTFSTGQLLEHSVGIKKTLLAVKNRVKTHTAFGYATQLCILDERGHVERFVAAHDVGRVVNPALCEGQIEGAIHMGLGYALTEELACEQGMPAAFNLREIGASSADCGCGHIGRPLAELARIVGYDVQLVDVCPERGDRWEFDPAAVTSSTYIVLMTEDHVTDEAALREALSTPAPYIGMIGSRRKAEIILEHLRGGGTGPESLARVRAPIGLDTGGREPAEIALAIIAEIECVQQGGAGHPRSTPN